MDLLEGLNQEQRQAVTHTTGPLLIVAGAGTGKTTVVTRRIAYLIEQGLADSDHILALTFTDKAAAEMEERVEALLPIGYLDFWVSTFHAFCDRILRQHALEVGLASDYRLLGATEQLLLLRRHIDALGLDYYKPKNNPTKFVQALLTHFSRLKDEDITPEQYLDYAAGLQLDTDAVDTGPKGGLPADQQASIDTARRALELARAYKLYQDVLRQENAVDFGDLIVETIHLLKARPAILQHYREQFRYILVDEFQDTNVAQYDLVKLLAEPNNNLTVVADDDQSIYSFRGASMSNIVQFQTDFPDCTDISLIQNYRSPQPILDLAYDFIQHNNPNRLEASSNINKRLQANTDQPGTIKHIHVTTLDGEAQTTINQMIELKQSSPTVSWSDFVILVRANDHASNFIPYLDRADIPYQFLASQGLFSKQIILDISALLHVLDDIYDSRSWYRVLTFAVWQLPEDDIATLLQHGRQFGGHVIELLRNCRQITGLAQTTYAQIDQLFKLLAELRRDSRERSVGEITLLFLDRSGYLKHITDQDTRAASEQILYLNEFFQYIKEFEAGNLDKTVHAFLLEYQQILHSGERGAMQLDYDQGPEAVRIMTVHAAKGLEFDYVFVVNLVDKRFPATGRGDAIPVPEALLAGPAPDKQTFLEEERRLFYVAVTRAKKHLYFTSSEDYGGARKKKPSRFLLEAGFVDLTPTPTGKTILDVSPSSIPQQIKPNELTHLPSSFSFSQLMAYDTCPWQYRFNFVLKVPVPGKASFSFGKSAHATLFEFFRRMKQGSELQQTDLFGQTASPKLTLDDLLSIYDEKWIPEWYDSQQQREDYYEKGRAALKQFYDLHHANWPQVAYLEQGFRLKLGEHTIKGAIDRVDTVNDGLKIVDYKTGSFPKSGKKDFRQLYLYALAVKEVFEQMPQKLEFYFLEDNKSIATDVDPEQYLQVSDWALGLIDTILTGDFTPTPGFHCTFCDFRDICEYKK